MGNKLRFHRLLSAALVAVLAALLLSFAPVGTAHADSYSPAVDTASAGRGVCDRVEEVEADTLPVNRWAAGTDQFHDRLGTKAWNDVAEKMQRRGVMSLMFSIGNFAWVSTTGMVESAVNFCILDKVGGTVDNAAHKIGNSIMESGIVAAFVVFSLIIYIWRLSRGSGGSGDTSMLFQKLLIVALFGLMLAGARASTGGTGGASDYEPGFGSPGWFVTTIDDIVSASASTIATNVADRTTALKGAEEGWNGQYAGRGTNDEGGGSRGFLGCAPYVKAMKDLYREKYTNEAGYLSASAGTPLMLSSMWEKSGLRMWQKAQFGNKNYYGHFMYCRLLEYSGDATLETKDEADSGDVSIERIQKRAARNAGVEWGAEVTIGEHQFALGKIMFDHLAWRDSGSTSWRDRRWVGWAACARPGKAGEGDNDPGRWLVHEDGGGSDTQLGEKCDELFTEAGWDGGGGGGEFDWDDSDDDISDTDTASATKDFLLSLHGNNNGGGLMAGLVYMISSLMIAVIFIMLAIAILVAKIAALVMMLLVFGALLVALLPNMSATKVFDYGKQYFGLSLFAWAAQLLLSILALMTGILVTVGAAMVPSGPGGTMDMLWVGFAPVLSLIGLNMMFKRMGIPSPLKISSGMAWGRMAATGAVAGAAGTGGAMLGSKMMQRAKSRAGQKAKQTAGGLVGKERASRMKPGAAPSNGQDTSSASSAAGKHTASHTASHTMRSGQPAEGDAHTKAEAARAKNEEATAAKEFVKTDEGQKRLDEQKQAAGRGVKSHFSDRVTNAREQLRQKPVRTLAKGALVGGAVIGAGALTGGLAGAAIGAGALGVGKSGMAKTARTLNPMDRSRSQADRVNAYKSHQDDLWRGHEQRQQEAKETARDQRLIDGLRKSKSEPAPSGEEYGSITQLPEHGSGDSERSQRIDPGTRQEQSAAEPVEQKPEPEPGGKDHDSKPEPVEQPQSEPAKRPNPQVPESSRNST